MTHEEIRTTITTEPKKFQKKIATSTQLIPLLQKK
jgi:hypothetical protein